MSSRAAVLSDLDVASFGFAAGVSGEGVRLRQSSRKVLFSGALSLRSFEIETEESESDFCRFLRGAAAHVKRFLDHSSTARVAGLAGEVETPKIPIRVHRSHGFLVSYRSSKRAILLAPPPARRGVAQGDALSSESVQLTYAVGLLVAIAQYLGCTPLCAAYMVGQAFWSSDLFSVVDRSRVLNFLRASARPSPLAPIPAPLCDYGGSWARFLNDFDPRGSCREICAVARAAGEYLQGLEAGAQPLVSEDWLRVHQNARVSCLLRSLLLDPCFSIDEYREEYAAVGRSVGAADSQKARERLASVVRSFDEETEAANAGRVAEALRNYSCKDVPFWRSPALVVGRYSRAFVDQALLLANSRYAILEPTSPVASRSRQVLTLSTGSEFRAAIHSLVGENPVHADLEDRILRNLKILGPAAGRFQIVSRAKELRQAAVVPVTALRGALELLRGAAARFHEACSKVVEKHFADARFCDAEVDALDLGSDGEGEDEAGDDPHVTEQLVLERQVYAAVDSFGGRGGRLCAACRSVDVALSKLGATRLLPTAMCVLMQRPSYSGAERFISNEIVTTDADAMIGPFVCDGAQFNRSSLWRANAGRLHVSPSARAWVEHATDVVEAVPMYVSSRADRASDEPEVEVDHFALEESLRELAGPFAKNIARTVNSEHCAISRVLVAATQPELRSELVHVHAEDPLLQEDVALCRIFDQYESSCEDEALSLVRTLAEVSVYVDSYYASKQTVVDDVVASCWRDHTFVTRMDALIFCLLEDEVGLSPDAVVSPVKMPLCSGDPNVLSPWWSLDCSPESAQRVVHAAHRQAEKRSGDGGEKQRKKSSRTGERSVASAESEVLLPRRALPALHVVTTTAPGLVDGFVQHVLEEEMAMYNIVRRFKLGSQVNAKMGEIVVTCADLCSRILKESGLDCPEAVAARKYEHAGMGARQAIAKAVCESPELASAVATLAVLHEVEEAENFATGGAARTPLSPVAVDGTASGDESGDDTPGDRSADAAARDEDPIGSLNVEPRAVRELLAVYAETPGVVFGVRRTELDWAAACAVYSRHRFDPEMRALMIGDEKEVEEARKIAMGVEAGLSHSREQADAAADVMSDTRNPVNFRAYLRSLFGAPDPTAVAQRFARPKTFHVREAQCAKLLQLVLLEEKYRYEWRCVVLRAARREALALYARHIPELRLLETQRNWVRLHTSLALSLARRTVIAENAGALKALVLVDPRDAYRCGARGSGMPPDGRGKVYHLIYAPSRVNLGAGERCSVERWPQWVGVADPLAGRRAFAFYSNVNFQPVVRPVVEVEQLKTGENQWTALARAIRNTQAYFVHRAGSGDVEALVDQTALRSEQGWNAGDVSQYLLPGPTGGYCIPKDLLFRAFAAGASSEKLLSLLGVAPHLQGALLSLCTRYGSARAQFASTHEWESWIGVTLDAGSDDAAFTGALGSLLGIAPAAEIPVLQDVFSSFCVTRGALAIYDLPRLVLALGACGHPAPLAAVGQDCVQRSAPVSEDSSAPPLVKELRAARGPLAGIDLVGSALWSRWAESKVTVAGEEVNRSVVFFVAGAIPDAARSSRILNRGVSVCRDGQLRVSLFGPYRADGGDAEAPSDVRFSFAMRLLMVVCGLGEYVAKSMDQQGRILARLAWEGLRPDSDDPRDIEAVCFLAQTFARCEDFDAHSPEHSELLERLCEAFPVHDSLGDVCVTVVGGIGPSELADFAPGSAKEFARLAGRARDALADLGVGTAEIQAVAGANHVLTRWGSAVSVSESLVDDQSLDPPPPDDNAEPENQALPLMLPGDYVSGSSGAQELQALGLVEGAGCSNWRMDVRGRDVVVFCAPHAAALRTSPAVLVRLMLCGRPASALCVIDVVSQGRHRVWFDHDVLLFYATARAFDQGGRLLPVGPEGWARRMKEGRRSVYVAFGFGDAPNAITGTNLADESARLEARAVRVFDALMRVRNGQLDAKGFGSELFHIAVGLDREVGKAQDFEEFMLRVGRFQQRDSVLRRALEDVVAGPKGFVFNRVHWLALGGWLLLAGQSWTTCRDVLEMVDEAAARLSPIADGSASADRAAVLRESAVLLDLLVEDVESEAEEVSEFVEKAEWYAMGGSTSDEYAAAAGIQMATDRLSDVAAGRRDELAMEERLLHSQLVYRVGFETAAAMAAETDSPSKCITSVRTGMETVFRELAHIHEHAMSSARARREVAASQRPLLDVMRPAGAAMAYAQVLLSGVATRMLGTAHGADPVESMAESARLARVAVDSPDMWEPSGGSVGGEAWDMWLGPGGRLARMFAAAVVLDGPSAAGSVAPEGGEDDDSALGAYEDGPLLLGSHVQLCLLALEALHAALLCSRVLRFVSSVPLRQVTDVSGMGIIELDPAAQEQHRSVAKCLAGFFGAILNDHFWEYSPVAMHPSFASAFSACWEESPTLRLQSDSAAREALFRQSWISLRSLYWVLRWILEHCTALAVRSETERTALLGDVVLGDDPNGALDRVVAPGIGSGANMECIGGFEALWLSFMQVRELAVLLADGVAPPMVLSSIDGNSPVGLNCAGTVAFGVLAPIGRSHYTRAVIEAPALGAHILITRGATILNVPRFCGDDEGAKEEGGKSSSDKKRGAKTKDSGAEFDLNGDGDVPMVAVHDALMWVTKGRLRAALGEMLGSAAIAHSRVRAEQERGAIHPKGVLVAAQFTQPVLLSGVAIIPHHPLERSILLQANLPHTLTSPMQYAVTYDKGMYPRLFGPDDVAILPPQVSLVRADLEKDVPSDSRKLRLEWVRTRIRPFVLENWTVVVKGTAESGRRSLRVFRPVRPPTRATRAAATAAGMSGPFAVLLESELDRAASFATDVMDVQDVVVQRLLEAPPAAFLNKSALAAFEARLAAEKGRAFRDGSQLFTSLRVIMSGVYPGATDAHSAKNWSPSHWMYLVSTEPATNVSRSGLVELFDDSRLQKCWKDSLLAQLCSVARNVMSQISRHSEALWKDADFLSRQGAALSGLPPVDCLGTPAWWPNYLMLDFLPEPHFVRVGQADAADAPALDVVSILGVVHYGDEKGPGVFAVLTPTGRVERAVVVSFSFRLVESNVDMGLWGEVWHREVEANTGVGCGTLEGKGKEEIGVEWNAVGVHARAVLRDFLTVAQSYVTAANVLPQKPARVRPEARHKLKIPPFVPESLATLPKLELSRSHMLVLSSSDARVRPKPPVSRLEVRRLASGKSVSGLRKKSSKVGRTHRKDKRDKREKHRDSERETDEERRRRREERRKRKKETE